MASIKSLTKNELVNMVATLQEQVTLLTKKLSAAEVQRKADKIAGRTNKATVVFEWEDKSDAFKHRVAATRRARAEGKPWNYGVSHHNGKYQVMRYEKMQ